MSEARTLTVGVLAGAYRGRDVGRRTLLTHLVYCDDQGSPERSGCRQNIDNMAIFVDSPLNEQEKPTCPTCAKKWEKIYGNPDDQTK